MARPRQPLLSRDAVVKASLSIIDRDGLSALSIPTLAAELGVRPPSLYHHFRDKAEILSEVARAIVLETSWPKARAEDDWIEWNVELCANFRRTVLRHRNAAPVLLQFLPRDILLSRYEKSARKLAQAGVPSELHVTILDGCEKLALGSGLAEAVRNAASDRAIFRNVDPAESPVLARALEEVSVSAEELFKQEVRNFLRGCLLQVGAVNGKRTAPRRKTAAAG